MSRPIRYRAWLYHEKKYVYVLAIHFAEIGEPTTIDYIEDGKIKTAIVGQFELEQDTGLKDKNGKRIHEGDIVNITAIAETDDSDMACIMDTNSIVCWDKKYSRWDVNDKPEDEDWDYRRRRYFVFVDSEDRESVEVIGNIHENKDLLG